MICPQTPFAGSLLNPLIRGPGVSSSLDGEFEGMPTLYEVCQRSGVPHVCGTPDVCVCSSYGIRLAEFVKDRLFCCKCNRSIRIGTVLSTSNARRLFQVPS